MNAFIDTMRDTATGLKDRNDKVAFIIEQAADKLERRTKMLNQCLTVFADRNFTDRTGMADRIRAALEDR